MTPKDNPPEGEDKSAQLLEEICENTRAIRRVVNRILDHLHESEDRDNSYDPDAVGWEDLYENDDMYC
jgi:hypothetical protein